MSRIVPLFLIVWVSILLAGCEIVGSSEADDDTEGQPAIQTDKKAYTVGFTDLFMELTVEMRYTNRTRRIVYLPRCLVVHSPILEKLEDGEWVFAYAPVVSLCLGPPVVVMPDAPYAYTFEMHAGLRSNNLHPKFKPDEVEGVYRLAWEIYRTWQPDNRPGLGTLLPLEQRISNTFRLVE